MTRSSTLPRSMPSKSTEEGNDPKPSAAPRTERPLSATRSASISIVRWVSHWPSITGRFSPLARFSVSLRLSTSMSRGSDPRG